MKILVLHMNAQQSVTSAEKYFNYLVDRMACMHQLAFSPGIFCHCLMGSEKKLPISEVIISSATQTSQTLTNAYLAAATGDCPFCPQRPTLSMVPFSELISQLPGIRLH